MSLRPRSILPRGLYGRALLILVVPIVTIQLVVSIAFIQRHFEAVTRQMTEGVLIEMRYALKQEAEAAGLSATGIGCYFDDSVHELLGLADSRWQSLYHFTLGRAVWDERLSSLPAYPEHHLPPR